MPAPKGNRNAIGNRGGGRPSSYRPEYAEIAQKACDVGYTDKELADLFKVSESTINQWKLNHVEFSLALKVGKGPADERVERSLYHRANGYTFDAVKIFPPRGDDTKPLIVPYREHVPPDTAACRYWLSNRRPEQWRERVEHTGKDGGPMQFTLQQILQEIDGTTRGLPAPAVTDPKPPLH